MNILDNIKLTYTYIGYDTRSNMPKMNDYKVTLKYNNKKLTINYSIGAAYCMNDIKNKDVLFSIISDSECTDYNFHEFCDNFGYNDDSIKALNIYKECKRTAKKLNNMFNKNELSELKELLKDY